MEEALQVVLLHVWIERSVQCIRFNNLAQKKLREDATFQTGLKKGLDEGLQRGE